MARSNTKRKDKQKEDKQKDDDITDEKDDDSDPAPEEPEVPSGPQKVQMLIQLPSQCTVLVAPIGKDDDSTSRSVDKDDEAKAPAEPVVAASVDEPGLNVSLLDNITVHELQLLILQSATRVPVPFGLWHAPAPAVPSVDTISKKYCTEQTFAWVNEGVWG